MTLILHTSGSLIKIERPLQALCDRGEKELIRGLKEGGDKTRTKVRHALKKQMNVKRYGIITKATSSRLNPMGSNPTYTITGQGKGLPISNFPVKKVKGGIMALPWQHEHRFKRSFFQPSLGGDGFKARTSSKRYPVRALLGPSPAKEIVKGESLKSFEASCRMDVYAAIQKRLGRLLGS